MMSPSDRIEGGYFRFSSRQRLDHLKGATRRLMKFLTETEKDVETENQPIKTDNKLEFVSDHDETSSQRCSAESQILPGNRYWVNPVIFENRLVYTLENTSAVLYNFFTELEQGAVYDTLDDGVQFCREKEEAIRETIMAESIRQPVKEAAEVAINPIIYKGIPGPFFYTEQMNSKVERELLVINGDFQSFPKGHHFCATSESVVIDVRLPEDNPVMIARTRKRLQELTLMLNQGDLSAKRLNTASIYLDEANRKLESIKSCIEA